MNSKPPKPNSQVSIYMNLQNEMEIAEKYSNLPYTTRFHFFRDKISCRGGSGPPPPTSTRQLTILLTYPYRNSIFSMILMQIVTVFKIQQPALGKMVFCIFLEFVEFFASLVHNTK